MLAIKICNICKKNTSVFTIVYHYGLFYTLLIILLMETVIMNIVFVL